jgi:nucleoid-associated protein YgaU
MADLNQLKQKYQPVLNAIQNEGGRVDNVDLQGEQIHIKAEVPSEASKNRVWDAIKSVDPTFADLKHEVTVDQSLAQTYTVQAGDNLSKISKRFYGDPNKYMRIAQANGLEDPDKIKIGMELKIPPAA